MLLTCYIYYRMKTVVHQLEAGFRSALNNPQMVSPGLRLNVLRTNYISTYESHIFTSASLFGLEATFQTSSVHCPKMVLRRKL